ncbi:MAG: hypothetical protein EOO08_01080 [Chitinophagaceae bacterium]|nr:MAG: hypothetical protein EOO08_01080 [Chitinophagaceae bacterium]
MNRKSALPVLLLVALAACTKHEYFRTSSYLINHSAHRIVLTAWLRDSAYRFRTVALRPGARCTT